MATDRILSALDRYFEQEHLLGTTEPGSPNRPVLREGLRRASDALRTEFAAYVEAHREVPESRQILVGVDDSEQAGWALDEAIRLARLMDARVCLVHVVDVAPVLVPEFAFEVAMREPGLVAEGWDLVHAMSERIPPGYRGQLLVPEGPADKEIVLAAQELGAELLVIGTHGRGLLGRFLLGSTAESVVRHATCPVVTVGAAPRSENGAKAIRHESHALLAAT